MVTTMLGGCFIKAKHTRIGPALSRDMHRGPGPIGRFKVDPIETFQNQLTVLAIAVPDTFSSPMRLAACRNVRRESPIA